MPFFTKTVLPFEPNDGRLALIFYQNNKKTESQILIIIRGLIFIIILSAALSYFTFVHSNSSNILLGTQNLLQKITQNRRYLQHAMTSITIDAVTKKWAKDEQQMDLEENRLDYYDIFYFGGLVTYIGNKSRLQQIVKHPLLVLFSMLTLFVDEMTIKKYTNQCDNNVVNVCWMVLRALRCCVFFLLSIRLEVSIHTDIYSLRKQAMIFLVILAQKSCYYWEYSQFYSGWWVTNYFNVSLLTQLFILLLIMLWQRQNLLMFHPLFMFYFLKSFQTILNDFPFFCMNDKINLMMLGTTLRFSSC